MKRNSAALEAALAQLAAGQLRRSRTTIEGPGAHGGRSLIAGGRELIDFSSNDYLGLARHPLPAAAQGECAARYGAGSGASHLVSGHGSEHARLEEELAAFTQRERALLFSTGYMANLAVLASLADRNERVLLDRLCHASLIDGARLAGATLKRYGHADAAAAERRRSALAQAARAGLVVDDAHGLGVLGASGRGVLVHFGLDSEAAPVLIGTLGKAFGSFGAFVAGDAALIELLVQKARPYIYTTALPQGVAAATRAALRVAQAEGWRRERVHALTARFRAGALTAGVPLAASTTPIQPVMLGSAAAVLSAQRQLQAAGLWVVAIRPPTVPAGSARLRVTLSAAHSEAQVDALIDALGEACTRAAAESAA